jgi:tetratricopeptide (TPR) repeat protein
MLASALTTLGWVDIRQGLYLEAREYWLESQAYCLASGDRTSLANILNTLGTISAMQNDSEKAKARFLEGLALARERGARPYEAAALCNLGEIARLQGDNLVARQYCQKALEIYLEIDDTRSVALIKGNLGHVASALGDYAAALSCYREALEIAMKLQAAPRILECLCGWAGVLAHTGQSEQALELLGSASSHPALQSDARSIVAQVLTDLRAQLSPEQVEAGLARSKALKLEEAVQKALAEFK